MRKVLREGLLFFHFKNRFKIEFAVLDADLRMDYIITW